LANNLLIQGLEIAQLFPGFWAQPHKLVSGGCAMCRQRWLAVIEVMPCTSQNHQILAQTPQQHRAMNSYLWMSSNIIWDRGLSSWDGLGATAGMSWWPLFSVLLLRQFGELTELQSLWFHCARCFRGSQSTGLIPATWEWLYKDLIRSMQLRGRFRDYSPRSAIKIPSTTKQQGIFVACEALELYRLLRDCVGRSRPASSWICLTCVGSVQISLHRNCY